MAASLPSRLENNNKWYFTRQQIENSPSRRAGLDPDKELSYRQQAANLLQDMGQRLNVSQLTINTAIVYMHRFYMIQSFTRFHRNMLLSRTVGIITVREFDWNYLDFKHEVIAPAALFLAAKVEEQPRKLEHVIKVAHACLNPQDPSPDTRSDTYLQQAQDLVILESIILQTLAFEITIDHPHTHVVKCTQLVRASKDLAQTSYFMATNSLHLTTFCLQYSPPVVACVCIHLACKWSNWEIPVSTDSKHWWEYVDPTVTLELLDDLTHEFLQILEKTPSRLKRIRNWKAAGQTAKKPKVQEEGDKTETMMNMISMASSGSALAGLMNLSAPPSGSSGASAGEEKDRGSAGGSQSWQPGGKDQQQQPNHEPPPPPRMSLSEYRAKHADELAAQKKKLVNMEASVKREYATATQALLDQQRKEKHHHHHHHHHQQQQQAGSASSDASNPSPIVLKIPLDERHDRGSLKMRLPTGGAKTSHGSGSGSSSRGSEQDITVRIRVPDRRGGSGEEGKSRERHRDRSNHHHHYHHHHHHSSSISSSSSSSSSSSAHKHPSSTSASGSSKKVSGDTVRTSSSSSSSRKRTHPSELSSGQHPPSKVGKSSRNSYQLPALAAPPTHGLPHAADILPSLGISHHPGNYSHSKADKADTNGHNNVNVAGGSQSNEYQDTFDMLNSLLSAQGVQPAQPQMFDYHSQYGEYRYGAGGGGAGQRGGSAQPPPLPSEPPPQLPPLPK